MLPLDLHAHIEPDIPAQDLDALDACVVAATRSLDEFEAVRRRDDARVAWGVGCHPGVAKAVNAFDRDRFADALAGTAFVSEIGLDGASKVDMSAQLDVFTHALSTLVEMPRIASVHSYKATGAVVDLIEAHQPRGIVLHWWLGTREETVRAVEAGAYFSVNASQARRWKHLDLIPSERLLLETDHPFGDRSETAPRRPGNVLKTEEAIARQLGRSPPAIRNQGWKNLAALAAHIPEAAEAMPRAFRVEMLSAF